LSFTKGQAGVSGSGIIYAVGPTMLPAEWIISLIDTSQRALSTVGPNPLQVDVTDFCEIDSNNRAANFNTPGAWVVVPVPLTALLLGSGLIPLVWFRRRILLRK
jgi:hypothetical protein